MWNLTVLDIKRRDLGKIYKFTSIDLMFGFIDTELLEHYSVQYIEE